MLHDSTPMNDDEKRVLIAASDQVAEDRRLAALGMRLIERYAPPSVVPDGARAQDINDCRDEHRAAFDKWEADYLKKTPKTSRERQAMIDTDDAYVTRQGDPRSRSYVNLEALQYVHYLLDHEPLWVRAISLSWEMRWATGPLPKRAWPDGWFTLAMLTTAVRHSENPERPYLHDATVYYLKSHDFLSHVDRSEDELPARSVPWVDIATEDAIYLTGIPTPPLKRAVRQIVGSWVVLGRKRRLPWDEQERGA